MTASDATPDGVGRVDGVDHVVDGPVPKHAQLREILRRVIERKLPPGSRIPSERELAGRYRVSRVTVRAAIGRLADEGLLTRVRGKGTFTAAQRNSSAGRPVEDMTSWYRGHRYQETTQLDPGSEQGGIP